MERELIAEIQALKAKMAERFKELTAVQKQAGRGAAQNACFLTLAELNVWHGRATERLYEHFPEFANDIVVMGPGR